MHDSTQNLTQVQTVFGGEYVQEHHRDETHYNLPPTNSHTIMIATVWLVFFVLAVVNVGLRTFSVVDEVVTASISSDLPPAADAP